MNKLLAGIAALLLPCFAWAQADPADVADSAQRARIAAERGQVGATFAAEEKACYQRFAVNDCLLQARAKRRAAMADLKRQETSLNDAERRRRAAQHQREIEERGSPAPQPRSAGGQPVPQRDREAQAAQRAADRARKQAGKTPPAERSAEAQARAVHQQAQRQRKEADRQRRAQEAAQNVRQREAQEREAQERRAALDRRQQSRKKPPARPLPVPP
jgi:hypothetical protein